MTFATLLQNIRYKWGKKETDGVKVEGLKDDIAEADQYSHFGFCSSAPKGTIHIKESVSENGRLIVSIASKSYKVEIDREDGEACIFSTDESGENIKSKVHLKNDGTVDVETEGTVNLKAAHVNLGEGGEAIARENDLVTGQIIIPAGSSAGTYNITNGKVAEGSTKHTAD